MDRLTEQAALLVLFQNRKSGWSVVADEVEARGGALDALQRAGSGGAQSRSQ
jgi:hypothetical protein